jgi:flagellar biosynthesis chaperone FliJ
MARFATLIELYRNQEEEARRELGRRERRRADLLAERERLLAERLAAAIAVDPAMHEQYLVWWRTVDVRLAGLDRDLKAIDQALAEARAELIAAHRRTTTIAKLRELDDARAEQAVERRRQRANDEFATRPKAVG